MGYGNIEIAKRIKMAGVHKIEIFAAPNSFFTDQADGMAKAAGYSSFAEIADNANFFKLDMIDGTVEFSATPKRNDGGVFWAISLTGESNLLSHEQQLRLVSFVENRVQALLLLKDGSTVLVGDSTEGLDFMFTTEAANDANKITIDLLGDVVKPLQFTTLTA